MCASESCAENVPRGRQGREVVVDTQACTRHTMVLRGYLGGAMVNVTPATHREREWARFLRQRSVRCPFAVARLVRWVRFAYGTF